MTITTPSGYEVYLKEALTFGQRREYNRLILSGAKIKPLQNKVETEEDIKIDMPELDPDLAFQSQDLAFKFLVEKIVIDGTEYTDKFQDLVMNWQEEDGQAVYNAISEITKKKGSPQTKK